MNKMSEISRGYDRKSINRHSWRMFTHDSETCYYVISKTTDCFPNFYEAYTIHKDTGLVTFRFNFPEENGSFYFGENLSWNNAIEFFENANFS